MKMITTLIKVYKPSAARKDNTLSYVYISNSVLYNYIKLIFYAMMARNIANSDSSDFIKSQDDSGCNKFQEDV